MIIEIHGTMIFDITGAKYFRPFWFWDFAWCYDIYVGY